MKIFTNYYECPNCEYTWESEWDSACDDECTECGHRDISPYNYKETIYSKFGDWEVYLNEEMIDKVFFDKSCDVEYVKSSLIDHDGYSSNIVVIPCS